MSNSPENEEWRPEAITPAMLATLRALFDQAILQGAYLAGGAGLAPA